MNTDYGYFIKDRIERAKQRFGNTIDAHTSSYTTARDIILDLNAEIDALKEVRDGFAQWFGDDIAD